MFKYSIGVLHSNNKTLVKNIALIVSTVHIYGSLKLWAHLAFDDRYCKYLINGIGNTPTQPPGPPPSSNTNIAQPPSTPSPTRPSPGPLTLPPPCQKTRPSPIPSPQEAPTFPRDRTPICDTDVVGETRRDSLGILLLTGRPTEREIKTRYRRLARIYRPEKHNPESTGMTSNQAEYHFKNINNAYEDLISQL